MLKLTSIFIVLMFGTLTFAAAGDTSTGCGQGWKVNSKLSLSATTTRGTTNSVSGGVFGTTSGTSGCERYSIVKNDKKEIHYVEANYESLLRESAAGHGEVLDGLAATMGCQSAALGTSMRSNYSDLIDQAGPARFLQKVKVMVETQPSLQQQCLSRTNS